MSSPPDSRCRKCGAILPQAKHNCSYERRQVIDLPSIQFEVTEFKSAQIECNCGTINTAPFPETVRSRVQYGERTRATALYLGTYQMIPYERLQELFEVLFNRSLSQGTLANFVKKGGSQAEVAAMDIHNRIKAAPLIHGDETGCRVHGKRQWLHVASTELLTYFMIHPKRGFEALEAIGLLNGYTGKVMHDHYCSYYRYQDCQHFQCNAHIIRELTYIHEDMGQAWAKDMKDLILEAKSLRERENLRQANDRKVIGAQTRNRIEERYADIVLQGYSINPEPEPVPGKRGRPKRGKALNLLHRFENEYEEIMGFFEYDDVPFDNNLAERDLRMMKIREKVSGTFRSDEHTAAFANIRSVISTLKKQGSSVFGGITDMMRSPEKMFS